MTRVTVATAPLITAAQSVRGYRERQNVSELLADTLYTYQPNRNDTIAPGDIIRTRAEGFSYEVLAAGASGDVETAGGVKLRGLGAVVPEAFPSIEAAIAAAAQAGRALRGTPGRTYTFTDGVTVAGLVADFTGCKLRRGAAMPNRSVLRVEAPFSAATFGAADAITAYSVVEWNFGNGATFVPRITVASTAGYSVGQIVKVMSSDRIPSIAPWQDTRYAEMGEIGAVDAGNGYLYLIRPFAETWTPERIVGLTATDCEIVGGEWFDEPGYPAARNAPMVELRGLVRPAVRDMHFRDTASTQMSVESCYEPVSRGMRYDRPRHSILNNSFAYGEKHLGTTRPVQQGAVGSRCRHVFDTGGWVVADGDIDTSSPLRFGGVVQAVVANGVGYDSLNAPFNDHPDAFETRIINCHSLYTNRAASGATLWGLQLRGRGGIAIGGVYDGLNPLRVEPSTSVKTVLRGVTFQKRPFNDTDAARQSLAEIIGGGVIGGGKARVVMEGVRIEQRLGRKELLLMQNASVEFSGSIEYAASLSNPVFARLESGSDLTVHALTADFSASTAATPMLTFLVDAGSRVDAPGRVIVKGSTAGGSAIVLTDFNSVAGQADWRDVSGDGSFFGNESGWRNAGSAGLQRAIIQRSDTGARNNDITVNFSGSTGDKTITWPVGTASPQIYVAVNATFAGTELGTIPNGAFTGQRAILANVGTESFEVNSDPSNVAPAATRTVLTGASLIMRWSGTEWIA